MYFVYFIKSEKNDKIYIGRTDKEPKVRLEEHNQGSNTWTKQNRSFKLVHYESFLCKEDSIKKEAFYKTGIGSKIKLAICKLMDD